MRCVLIAEAGWCGRGGVGVGIGGTADAGAGEGVCDGVVGSVDTNVARVSMRGRGVWMQARVVVGDDVNVVVNVV
jgi:hypothetical protein